MPAATAKKTAEITAFSSERSSFGNLASDGFRITRWDEANEPAGRHWFDAHAIVLCLNVTGSGRFHAGGRVTCAVEPGSMVLSSSPKNRQHLERSSGGRHRFVAMEMRRPWVSRWLPAGANELRDPVARFLKTGKKGEAACEVHPMTAQIAQLAADVLQPPKVPAAWACWHHAKALEMISHSMFVSEEGELFCERTKRIGRERIVRVQEIILADLENPPALAELGRMVGCSPFYLSRMFRQETGVTISSFLRRARLDRAAELIRAGEANVTEAAITVGYSSLSHFSKAFAETFGCCPCLYGRKA
jgi:AraC-like DNA-binding protein